MLEEPKPKDKVDARVLMLLYDGGAVEGRSVAACWLERWVCRCSADARAFSWVRM